MKIFTPFFLLLFTFVISCQSQPGGGVLEAKSFDQQIKATADAVVLDVRTPEEFNKGHIERAINLNYNDPGFKSEVKALDKNKTYFVYCLAGSRSRAAATTMRNEGVQDVIELEGGILAWQKSNLPVVTPGNVPVQDQISMQDYLHLISSADVVLIDFYAPWCAPCKKMEPSLTELSKEYEGKAKIIRLNIDENKQLAHELGVEEIPLIKIFRQGKESWTHKGLAEKDELIKALGF